MLNRLNGTYCYLVGCIDRCTGTQAINWRRSITPFLEYMGVNVIDPTNKKYDIGLETDDARQERKLLKEQGRFEEIAEIMKVVRNYDLRSVDISSFLICHIDISIYACGTWEEVTWANQQRKPILFHIEGGLQNTPDWLFAMVPLSNIFGDWLSLRQYLKHINNDEEIDLLNRWRFIH